jgi:hypothetical protein
MSSNKRDFKNFEQFQGHIDKDKNLYVFPSLYRTTDNGKMRIWTIYIRCIKEDSKSPSTNKQNWDLMCENEVPIDEKYIRDGQKMPVGIIAEYWTEGGVVGMKISRSAATYVAPKNIGKQNERNTLQQALVECRSKYLKKIDEGLVLSVGQTVAQITSTTKYYPMLARKYTGEIKYPVYIQPKLDGCRCISFLNNKKNPTYKDVILYSRGHKEYNYNQSNNEIRKALLPILIKKYDHDKNESLFLDGELYIHDSSLQEINSIVRGKAEGEQKIEYHVYDMFYPSYDKQSFRYRLDQLKLIDFGKNVLLVNSHYTKDQKENDLLYKRYLDNKYEGIMIRVGDCVYAKSATKESEQLRSKDLLKRKETYDKEFEVVGYSQGTKGKNVGAVIWICTSGTKTFNVVPNSPHEERYKIFEECEEKFDKKYKNRMLIVEYRGLSIEGIPLQGKAIGFRDYL